MLRDTDPVTLHGYTSAAGDPAVKAKLAENIRSRFGFEADPALMYMTCGAAASLTISLSAVVEEGEEVIVVGGAFDGTIGEVESIDTENSTVKIRYFHMGRMAAMEFPADQVKKL
jgi:aspartate/methionine/tyrosine aminotransferase